MGSDHPVEEVGAPSADEGPAHTDSQHQSEHQHWQIGVPQRPARCVGADSTQVNQGFDRRRLPLVHRGHRVPPRAARSTTGASIPCVRFVELEDPRFVNVSMVY